MDCNNEFFLYISLRSWRPSVDSSEKSVRAIFWILAEERLKKATKGKGAGRDFAKERPPSKKLWVFE